MIKPAEELGPALTGRFVAEDLRRRIEAELDAGGDVIVDFEGVAVMSPSFADEVFAKLSREAVEAGRVRFENLDDDLLALVDFVVAGRPRT